MSKLTFQMKSPGQAWLDFVNSKEGHNAAAVTPEWLKSPDKNLEDPFVHEKANNLKQAAERIKASLPKKVVRTIDRNTRSK